MTPFEAAFISRIASDTFVKDVALPNRTLIDISPFWENATYTGFNASAASQSALIQTQADSDFICTSIAARARIQATQLFDPLPLCWIQITDQASGKTWFNTPLITRIVAGDFGQPALLAFPRSVQPNSTIQIDVQPVDTRYDNFWISLGGVRLFYEATQ